MVKMSRALVMLCISLCAACSGADLGNEAGEEESGTTAQVDETLLFSSVPYRGVNLASAEFGMDSQGNGAIGVHGTEYVYPDPAYAAGYRSADYYVGKKMNTFRLPFRWERLQPVRNQALNAAELTRLRTTVRNMIAKGAVVLLDPHNYARYTTQVIGAGIPNAHFADFWARLANEFKNDKNVIFGLMNEPFDMPTEQWVNAANAAITAIRNTGAANLILVPGNAWSGAHSWTQNWYGTANAQALLAIRDPKNNYGFEVHQYLDSNFSGTSADCPSATAPAQSMQEFTNWLRTHGKKGFLGEFAGGSSGTCLSALDNLMKHMHQNADVYLGWTYWAGGPWWGGGLSLEPNGSTDKPQMDVLERYLTGSTVPASTGGDNKTCSGRTYQAETMWHSKGKLVSNTWKLTTWGYIATTHAFTARPTTITVTASGTYGGGAWSRMTVFVDGKAMRTFNVSSTSLRAYSFAFTPTSGAKQIRVRFDNDYFKNGQDRNLVIDKVAVTCQ